MVDAAKTNMTIVDTLAERLKGEPIGTLIKEEDLTALVKVALNKAFVDSYTTYEGSGSYNRRDHPGLIVQMLREHLNKAVADAVRAWAQEHKDEIMVKVTEALGKDTEKLIMAALINIISPVQQGAIDTIHRQLYEINARIGDVR